MIDLTKIKHLFFCSLAVVFALFSTLSFRVKAEDTGTEYRQEGASYYLGDVDLDSRVTAADARTILRQVLILTKLPTDALPLADVNEDGVLSAADARLTLRIAVDLDRTTAHAYTGQIVLEPTCTQPGTLYAQCAECKKEITLTVPENGHTFTEQILSEPTCVTAGTKESTCAVCFKRIQSAVPPRGHEWIPATPTRAKTCAVCGNIADGWAEIENKWIYYLPDGSVPKGIQLFADETGRIWFTEDGVRDVSVRRHLTRDGKDWLILNGQAKSVTTAEDRTLFRAFSAVEDATDPGMTKEEKLYACFQYAKTTYRERNPRSPHYTQIDWPILYANDMFINGEGNCFSYAAAFCYMARAIGYEEVYGCNSGGHGWAEIDGLVYDPEWSRSNTHYTYYALSYYTKTDVNYRGAIAAGLPWMHVKIYPEN